MTNYLCQTHGHVGQGCGGSLALAFNEQRSTVQLIGYGGEVLGQVYVREAE